VLATVFGAALLFRFGAVVKGIRAITAALRQQRAIAALGGLSLNPAGAALGAGARGAGGLGAVGAAGVIPGLGLAAGITIAGLEVGDWIDSMITTDEGRMRAQYAGMQLRKGASFVDAINAGINAKLDRSSSLNYAPTTNITINAQPGETSEAAIRRVAREIEDENLRHARVQLTGGVR
jgi:hypothetical protein